MHEQDGTTARAEGLDRLSHTFTSDRECCDALAATHPGSLGRLLVYLRWARNYMPPIQQELHALTAQHFAAEHRRDAGFWTLCLTGGISRDLGLIPYLAVRGLIWDAGFALRRILENAGLLSHLWHDPVKAACLSNPDSGAFRSAFFAERDRAKADDLKAQGIQKRFASCHMGKAMTSLYRLLSAYSVHGSPEQLMTGELQPTRLSCMLVNRPDPLEKDLTHELGLFASGCELACVETAFVYTTYAKRYSSLQSKGGEGCYYLTKFLNQGPDSEMAHLLCATLQDLGWAEQTA